MPVTFSDNFDADAVGSTQTANWTILQSGVQPTVTAGSTLSAPNWFNSSNFAVSRNAAQLTGGAMQLSSYARISGSSVSAVVPNLGFNTNGVSYNPVINWVNNQLYILKYGLSGATVVSASLGASATIPAYANNAGYTVKMQYDPSTGGGPTVSVKLWPYGTAEPTPWTVTVVDNGTVAGLAPNAGSTFITRVAIDGSFTPTVSGIDDYFEGTVGTTFVVAGAAVTTLTITVSGNNRILTWPADAQATAYEVYRGSTATTLAFVATVATGTTTYTDAARPGGNIYYAVIAVH